ncbi:hypothetical protein JKG47_07590 [Acidithiobacillus sp. MC6.1]|nr:hypothetical protein [Acidithiobacillus sp. MC6.1]
MDRLTALVLGIGIVASLVITALAVDKTFVRHVRDSSPCVRQRLSSEKVEGMSSKQELRQAEAWCHVGIDNK